MAIWFRSNGDVNTRWLSNFYPASVYVPDDWVYESAEHAYQAQKVDPSQRHLFLQAVSPLQAKQLGGQMQVRIDFDPFESMRLVLRAKFTGSSALKQLLLQTGDEELIEDNPGPWGGRNGGENRLGKLLMELRSELRG